jgi:hypothetical protein
VAPNSQNRDDRGVALRCPNFHFAQQKCHKLNWAERTPTICIVFDYILTKYFHTDGFIGELAQHKVARIRPGPNQHAAPMDVACAKHIGALDENIQPMQDPNREANRESPFPGDPLKKCLGKFNGHRCI